MPDLGGIASAVGSAVDGHRSADPGSDSHIADPTVSPTGAIQSFGDRCRLYIGLDIGWYQKGVHKLGQQWCPGPTRLGGGANRPEDIGGSIHDKRTEGGDPESGHVAPFKEFDNGVKGLSWAGGRDPHLFTHLKGFAIHYRCPELGSARFQSSQ